MKYIILIGLLFALGCSPIRPYQKVVNDTYRNAKERSLLVQAYKSEFPQHQDTPTTTVQFDSSAYIIWLENEWFALADSLSNIKPIVINDTDSITVYKEKLKIVTPPAIVKVVTKEVKVWDDGPLLEKQKQVDGCRDEIRRLEILVKDGESAKTTNKWLFIILGISATTLIVRLILKFKKPF